MYANVENSTPWIRSVWRTDIRGFESDFLPVEGDGVTVWKREFLVTRDMEGSRHTLRLERDESAKIRAVIDIQGCTSQKFTWRGRQFQEFWTFFLHSQTIDHTIQLQAMQVGIKS